MNFNLKFKSNEALVTDLKVMVADERKLLIQILHYLREVEFRKLYVSRGFKNLFLFATQELGYSAGAASRRIRAMRLIKEIPQVEEKLESGKLSLSVAAQMQGFIWKEEKKRSEKNTEPILKSEKLQLIEQMEGISARECEKKLIALSPETALPREKARPLTEDKTLIQFVADTKLMKKIEKLKFLMAHQNYEGRYGKLFEKVIDMALERLDPSVREARRAKKAKAKSEINKKADGNRFQIDEEKTLSGPFKSPDKVFYPDNSTPTSELKERRQSGQPRNRHIPQAVRDQVWVRDHGECKYQDPVSGRVCGSRHGLQLDHVKPYALGGEHTPENLQLLCGTHNRYRNPMGNF